MPVCASSSDTLSCLAVVTGLEPARHTGASCHRRQTGKPNWSRRHQVIAPRAGKFKEFLCHFDTNRMGAGFRRLYCTPIAVVARDRICPAGISGSSYTFKESSMCSPADHCISQTQRPAPSVTLTIHGPDSTTWFPSGDCSAQIYPAIRPENQTDIIDSCCVRMNCDQPHESEIPTIYRNIRQC